MTIVSRSGPFEAPRVLVTRRIAAEALSLVEAACQMTLWDSDEPIDRESLIVAMQGCEGLLCLLTERIDAELLDAAGSTLRVVSTMSVGYDHVDVAACAERKIRIGNTPDVLTETTADLAIALMLAAARRLPEAMTAVKDGSWGAWKPDWMTGVDLRGATVGIVGLGRIGSAVARRLAGFECRILYVNSGEGTARAAPRGPERVDMDTLLGESDFVSIHAPLSERTRGMFSMPQFQRMKRSAILVNTSRGGLVDQGALLEALTTGTIGAAALDVTTPEPLPVAHPLLSLPNCIVLPHVGSATQETRRKMALLAARNLIAGLAGREMPSEVKV